MPRLSAASSTSSSMLMACGMAARGVEGVEVHEQQQGAQGHKDTHPSWLFSPSFSLPILAPPLLPTPCLSPPFPF